MSVKSRCFFTPSLNLILVVSESRICCFFLQNYADWKRNHNALGSIEQDPGVFGEEVARYGARKSVLRIRIRILGSGLENFYPDPTWIFLINSEYTKLLYHFLPDLNIYRHSKLKIKKNNFAETILRKVYLHSCVG